MKYRFIKDKFWILIPLMKYLNRGFCNLKQRKCAYYLEKKIKRCLKMMGKETLSEGIPKPEMYLFLNKRF